jgi:dihydroxyacetone kinase-like predicted kinase
MNNKIIKEVGMGQGTSKGSISTNMDTFKQNKDQFTDAVKQGTSVNVTSENDNGGSHIDVDKIIAKLGLNLADKEPNVVSKVKGIINKMMNHLKDNYDVSCGMNEGDDTPEELRGLYGDDERSEREMNYGVQNENFDAMMDKLGKSNSPIVNIKENVNPRIKKQDLINIINKK